MKDRIAIIRGDITKQQVDVIVNAANKYLSHGGGVCGAIHDAAGPDLLAECMTLNGCRTGEAKITGGYQLPAKYVIHAVGPEWEDGKSGESNQLRSAYECSLRLAVENNLRTIAFPSISTGIYGYPLKEAVAIAMKSIVEFLSKNTTIEKIIMVCFNDKTRQAYLAELKNYTN